MKYQSKGGMTNGQRNLIIIPPIGADIGVCTQVILEHVSSEKTTLGKIQQVDGRIRNTCISSQQKYGRITPLTHFRDSSKERERER